MTGSWAWCRGVVTACVAGAALAACAATSPARAPDPETSHAKVTPSATSPAATPAEAPVKEVAADPQLMKLLSASAVQGDDFARRVLYTWTTAEQARDLRTSKRLLTRVKTERGALSVFDDRLDKKPHPASALLKKPQLRYRRFAWPHAWATVLGADEQSYGDTLIRVVLKPDSIVGQFDPTRAEPWAFRDLNGKEVPLSEVLAQPERWAAVYHLAPDAPGGTPFREYVLINESALERFELSTPEIRAELERGLELARRLHESYLGATSPHELARAAPDVWAGGGESDAPLAHWLAAACFANDRYVPGAKLADRLALALRTARLGGDPWSQAPTVRFADQKAPPVIKPPPRKCWGTLC